MNSLLPALALSQTNGPLALPRAIKFAGQMPQANIPSVPLDLYGQAEARPAENTRAARNTGNKHRKTAYNVGKKAKVIEGRRDADCKKVTLRGAVLCIDVPYSNTARLLAALFLCSRVRIYIHTSPRAI